MQKNVLRKLKHNNDLMTFTKTNTECLGLDEPIWQTIFFQTQFKKYKITAPEYKKVQFLCISVSDLILLNSCHSLNVPEC